MIVKKYLYNYQTIIHFSSPVTNHFFSLRCMPCVNACQQVVKRDMFLHPSDYLIYGADAWGNPLQYGSRAEAHDAFIFVSSGEAKLSPYCIPEITSGDVFRVESALTGVSDSLKAFLAEAGPKKDDALDCALRLSEKIHDYMCYAPGTTQINTTAMEAFQQRKGVCQDYAHILIALCRACGIPARYVNGFMQGTGVTHAWVEVLVNGEWRGIDPTNNQLIEYGYIKLAHGRDALDCRVNRGVYTGHPTEQTEIRVIVEEL